MFLKIRKRAFVLEGAINPTDFSALSVLQFLI
jgi:hypothetical protein